MSSYNRLLSLLPIALLLQTVGAAASLPAPWGAISTGTVSASASGVLEDWILANSFEDTAGLSEAVMVTNEQQQVTTQLVGVGTGALSFSGGAIVFTGMNLAPGHPYNSGLDFAEVGGGGFSVPVVFYQAQPDDDYSVNMTATAATHGGSMTDPESDSGTPSATASATAVFGPTAGGATATPFTTFSYSGSVTVSENGGPADSLFSGGFSLDSQGNLTTNGDVSPADLTSTAGGFSFSVPIDFSTVLTDQTDSFVFDYQSEGDLITEAAATPEPPSAFVLFPLLVSLVILRWRTIARIVPRSI